MTIVADSWNTVSHYYLFSLPLFIMKTHSALTTLCLLCTIHCAATQQKAVSDTLLSARFNRYARENLIEKLYLHQDRTNYYAGETIWFKVYQTLSSSATEASRIVYIDLSNSKGEIVKQVKYPWQTEQPPVAFRSRNIYTPAIINFVPIPDGCRILIRSFSSIVN